MKNSTLNYKNILFVFTFLCSISVSFGQTLDFWNLQFPETGTQTQGGSYLVFAQVYENGVTDADNMAAGAGITAWIGYSTTNSDPSTWTNWVPATYNADVGNNDEFVADIGPSIPFTGTYYYASRFQYNAEPYVYGGILADGSAGGNWDGTTYISGVLTITCPETVTWDGTTWDNGTGPDVSGSSAVIINGDYSTQTNGGSFTACSLTVNAGTLSILNQDYIEVVNDITIAGGNILINSEASLVQIDDLASVSGTGSLQKATTTLTDWYDYTYWSSPNSNETIGTIFFGVPANRIFTYDAANFEDTDGDGFDDSGDDWIIAGQTDIMEPGRGYAAVAVSFIPLGVQNFSFNGTFNNGVITPAVTMSTGANPLNWNFLGNPYPSAIDADLFLEDAANTSVIGGTICLWTHNSAPSATNPGPDNLNFSVDDYAYYNSTGGVSAASGGVQPTGIIASAQGFFIEGLSAGVATFNNSMRVTTGNTNFFRKSQSKNERLSTKTKDRIWLNLSNEYGAFSQTLIGFTEHATNGVDRLYDGKRLDANNFVSIFSLIDDEKYAIQGREPVLENELIPMGIMTTIEQDMDYTISIDKVEGKLEASDVYLIDNYLNVEHNLNESAYTFSTAKGDFKDRFSLSLKTNLNRWDPTVANDIIVTNNQNNTVDISTIKQSIITNIKIYDVLGRMYYNLDSNDESSVITLNTSALDESLFIAKVTLSDGVVLTKKVLQQ